MKHQFIVIAGCGRLGSTLANQLSGEGHSVVVVDPDEGTRRNLGAEFSGFAVTADATEIAVLREVKLDRADTLIATTRDDTVNLMVAEAARRVFGVPRVVVRVFDPGRLALYRSLGLAAICPTQVAAELLLRGCRRRPVGELKGAWNERPGRRL